jgi:alginate production protein
MNSSVAPRLRRGHGRAGLAPALVSLAVLLLGSAPSSARAADAPAAGAEQPDQGDEQEEAESPEEAEAEEEEEEEEEEDLRERLTEREDKRRPLEPFQVEVGGRPLTIGGELEVGLAFLHGRIEEDEEDDDQLLLEMSLEVEAFYTFGDWLSLFAQLKAELAEDLLPNRFDEVSVAFLERGEMWIVSEDIAGTGISIDLGRLDFEDDRRWWWDEELDAVRVIWETERTEVALALARELFSARSDQSFVEPEHEGVLRVIGEASWDWRPNHALELFLVYQDDRSSSERPEEVFRQEREDDEDARLTWVGARLMGAHEAGRAGLLGYWLDTGFVSGEERFAEFEDLSRRRSVVEETLSRDVQGWGLDLGASWMFARPYEPRIHAGYALGSGDSSPEEGSDRSYRQTGLEENEAGFGGVERFNSYGVLLAPELSNLQVWTVGAGLSLLRSSSLDLVYHYYRQVDAAPFLRDARIDLPLTGRDTDLGHEVDLVLALEEWERFEFDFLASAFRAGRAFGPENGEWSFGAFCVMRYAF